MHRLRVASNTRTYNQIVHELADEAPLVRTRSFAPSFLAELGFGPSPYASTTPLVRIDQFLAERRHHHGYCDSK